MQYWMLGGTGRFGHGVATDDIDTEIQNGIFESETVSINIWKKNRCDETQKNQQSYV